MRKKIEIIIICFGLMMSGILSTFGASVGVMSAVDVHAETEELDANGVGAEEIDIEKMDDNETNAGETDDSEMDENEVDEDTIDVLPGLFIKAVNPGYKVDGVNNVGEMIEIGRTRDSDTPILLAGIAVSYTNSSGNTSILLEFPEHSQMTGETLLLKLASSPGSELANLTYGKTLAMNAKIELIINGEVVDEVCWTGKEGCYKAFNSSKPTTLVRNMETGEFEHEFVYVPNYDVNNYYVEIKEEETGEAEGKATPQCRGVEFSEILSYYESDKSEQFVELHNTTIGTVNLDGCKVRYKNKKYVLSGVMDSDGYYAYYPVGFSLTKNPTNSNKLELVDTDDTVVDTMEYPNGQKKGTAYAWLGYDGSGSKIWKTTYAPTPGAPNNYQEFKTCEVGKVINEVTGNCVKITNAASKICQEGYYLNILTGRCKKKTSIAEKTCKEGYYLNPETNRCKKIVENKGADYSLKPENSEENVSFIALYAVLGVLGAGALYLGYEFRHEIAKLGRKILRKD